MKGNHWNKEENKPDDVLNAFLKKKAASVRERIKEGTGLDIEPICYCAGYSEEGEEQCKPYNLTKLLHTIIQIIPREKRLALVDNLNTNKENWMHDDEEEDYGEETEYDIIDTIFDFIEGGSELGGKILGIPGKLVGGVAGAVVGTVAGIFNGAEEVAEADPEESKWDKFWEGFWNNKVNNFVNDVINDVNENTPIYESAHDRDADIFERITSGNFWSNFIGNMGWTSAMILSTVLTGGMGVASLGSKIATLLGASKNTAIWTYRLLGACTGSMSEAATEAINGYKEAEQDYTKLIQQQKELELRQLDDRIMQEFQS
jgi:hypothetical protein